MSNKTTIMPDYLFEVSWEVCNKVGGIYTVCVNKSFDAVAATGAAIIYLLGLTFGVMGLSIPNLLRTNAFSNHGGTKLLKKACA